MPHIPTPDGTRIWYRDHGSGEPVVLVAGLGDNAASWEAQIADLSSDHRVIAFDNRGIGESSTPPGPYSAAQMAGDAHAVVTALGLTGVTAIGSSMGGAICQEWAVRHPEDVGRLVIANSWGEQDALTNRLFDHWISLGSQGLGKHIIESLLVFCLSPGYLAANPKVAAEFLAQEPPRMHGFVAAAEACRSHDTTQSCQHIRQPTLIVAGAHDILTRPELSRRLQQRIGHARLAMMDTGHMTFWEQPQVFSVLVRGFLQGA